jgi:hypothetical protein
MSIPAASSLPPSLLLPPAAELLLSPFFPVQLQAATRKQMVINTMHDSTATTCHCELQHVRHEVCYDLKDHPVAELMHTLGIDGPWYTGMCIVMLLLLALLLLLQLLQLLACTYDCRIPCM